MFVINANTYAEEFNKAFRVDKECNKSFLWIKMHDIQDKLSVRNMPDLTIRTIKIIHKITSPARKQIEKYKRYGKEFRNDLAGIYILEDLVLSIKMDCRTSATIEFRTKLGFNQVI